MVIHVQNKWQEMRSEIPVGLSDPGHFNLMEVELLLIEYLLYA